jgi:chromosome segregation ATPase
MMESRLVAFQDRLKGVEKLEDVMVEGEKRAQEMTGKVEELTSTVEGQTERVSSLRTELEHVNNSRRDWLQEVHRLETRQREIDHRSEETEYQLDKMAEFSKELDDRRNNMLATETKLAHYEDRVTSLETLIQSLDSKMDFINSRQESVDQVKRQVDVLFDTCERARNDAMSVVSARKEIVDAKDLLETLARQTEAVDERFTALEGKHATIDEAEVRINALSNVIGDIHVNIQHFKQQKTVIDHVAEKLAQLDFSIKQADVLTKELQEERRLAGRIYQAIRTMRKPGTAQQPKPAVSAQAPNQNQGPINGK